MSENTAPPVAPEVSGKVSEPPRRRGRPPGSKNKPSAEPLQETAPGTDTAPRRGRPRKQHVEIDQTALARQIKGTHGLVAFAFGIPELMLDDKESAELATAFVNFAREFDWEPNPKVMAGLELAGVAGFIYIPRVIRVATRIRKQKQARGHTVNGEASEVKSESAAPGAAVN